MKIAAKDRKKTIPMTQPKKIKTHITLLLLIAQLAVNAQIVEISKFGEISINQIDIDSTTQIDDIKSILNEKPEEHLIGKSEQEAIKNGDIFDNYYVFNSSGLTVIIDGKSDRIIYLNFYFKKPNWESKYTPENLFKGKIKIEDLEITDLKKSELESFHLVYQKDTIYDSDRFYVANLSLEYKRTETNAPFHSIELETNFNNRNILGWSHREKSIYRTWYSESELYENFCQKNNCDKEVLINCLVEKMSNTFKLENYQLDNVNSNEVNKLINECLDKSKK